MAIRLSRAFRSAGRQRSACVAEHARIETRVHRSRPEIRICGVLPEHALQLESALLEYAARCRMGWMTPGVEAAEAKTHRKVDHRAQRLGRVARAPRVTRQHVSGCGPPRRFEREAGASEHQAVGATDQVWSTRPALPLGVAEVDELASVVDGGVTWPPQEPCHLWIACVSLEDNGRVSGGRSPQDESGSVNDGRSALGHRNTGDERVQSAACRMPDAGRKQLR